MDKFITENRELFAAVIGGLIGVFGSITTMVVSHYLKLAGKILVNLTRSNIVLSRLNNGVIEPTVFLDEAENLSISVGIDIYNSSDAPKSLRELGIEVKGKRGVSVIV